MQTSDDRRLWHEQQRLRDAVIAERLYGWTEVRQEGFSWRGLPPGASIRMVVPGYHLLLGAAWSALNKARRQYGATCMDEYLDMAALGDLPSMEAAPVIAEAIYWLLVQEGILSNMRPEVRRAVRRSLVKHAADYQYLKERGD